MKRINLSIILLLLLSQYGFAQKTVSLLSPDGRLTFSLKLSDEYPSYKIMFKKQILIKDSPLGFDFDNGTFGTGLKINKPIYRTGSETYELVVGKTKTVHSQYKEVTIPFEEKKAQGRKINMVVRAFDDGIAFRYEFPKQPDWSSYIMYDENTTFNLEGNPKALTLFLPSYTSSHEGPYTHLNYNDIEENKLMDMPIMLECPNNIFMSITEAAVVDYAGMYLMKENGMFVGKLSPLPGQTKIKVKADIPHRTPWRVISISDRVGAIIESNILTNLNEPCKIEDTSWLRPGKTTFTWWNGNVVPDTTFAPGNNFDTNKYYIDFAARSGLDYHSIYGYAEQPWYVDDGFDFGTPGPNSDITKPIKPLDMKAICKYAHSQGVGIHLWINWKPLYAKIDEAFALFQEWGISGMMVDFMDRDDQEMIRIQEEILAKAAKHHLFIQFHGSSKPSGLHRTYPNEFTREGTMNYEGYKWGAEINADHDISMPFTRLIAGATDYHLGGFRAVPENKFKVQFTNPLVTSTRCHMLAMYVVLESYLGMVCDTPPSYEGQPGFDFIQKLPTVWDEIKVLNASVNEYITIARRNGDSWYIGSLNNSEARALSVTLDFLDNKEYTADTYADSKDVDVNPNHLVKLTKKVKKGDVIELPLAASGGSVIRIY
ncbi:glycoside hydrolase family 97 protein [Dysgonomonas sp. ZJ709]|uniref:glycoside hydrolase family 97 protein n=1 Tax=Dysgonomonas sp. ZJ709 TaxID=2709797 RepID=UPI0013EDB192|nr:glycoside hydrolase family 97 protein [Dysgonomonas sp. ZJ709]